MRRFFFGSFQILGLFLCLNLWAKETTQEFTPPKIEDIPQGKFGDVVRLGHQIFMHTPKMAPEYAKNGLKCVNCHLGHGLLPHSAPLWAAYGMYPAYREKTGKVDTFQERIQGCFLYSMNGVAPAADSEVMTALVTYAFWMAKGTPAGVELKGRGYPELPAPPMAPCLIRGEIVYRQKCFYCHGDQGQGTLRTLRKKQDKQDYIFPPLWGNDSYNWGAGMHRINTAAAFIKANMPLGQGNTLSDQEAWDVAAFINSQKRPEDPRHQGHHAETKKLHHQHQCFYGEKAEGKTVARKQGKGH